MLSTDEDSNATNIALAHQMLSTEYSNATNSISSYQLSSTECYLLKIAMQQTALVRQMLSTEDSIGI